MIFCQIKGRYNLRLDIMDQAIWQFGIWLPVSSDSIINQETNDSVIR